MDISGKFVTNLPVQTGEGKNGQWQKGGFVIETPNERFPKKICFTTWGDVIAQTQSCQAGDDLKVSFDLESREYQGRWYSDIKAWKVEAAGASTGAPTAQPTNNFSGSAPTPPPPPVNNHSAADDDDLPF